MRQFFLYLFAFSIVYLLFVRITPSSCASKEVTASEVLGGIHFMEGDWNKALEQAKIQHKRIFLDAYASWCGPCKKLKRTTFADKTVGNYFNEQFINIAIDMEKGEGAEISRQLGVRSYPTLFLLDQDGKVLAKSIGFVEPDELIEFVKNGNFSN